MEAQREMAEKAKEKSLKLMQDLFEYQYIIKEVFEKIDNLWPDNRFKPQSFYFDLWKHEYCEMTKKIKAHLALINNINFAKLDDDIIERAIAEKYKPI